MFLYDLDRGLPSTARQWALIPEVPGAESETALETRRIRNIFGAGGSTQKRPRQSRLLLEERDQHLISMLQRWRVERSVENATLADLGCGWGALLRRLARQPGVSLALGIELVEERAIRAAAESGVDRPRVLIGDITSIPLDAHTVDVAVMLTVMSSVSRERWVRVADELDRILTPRGCILWYDMRLPSPRNTEVRSLRRRDLRVLFPGFELALESVTLLPPLARRVKSQRIYRSLAALPVLRSHLVGLLTRSAESEFMKARGSDESVRRDV